MTSDTDQMKRVPFIGGIFVKAKGAPSLRGTWVARLVTPLLAALSMASASVVPRQQPDIDARRLALGVDSLEIFLLSGGTERRIGRLWDEVQQVDIGGASLVRRVYRTENAVFGPTLDTTFSTWPELRPHSHRSVARIASADVEYRGDSAVGKRSVNAGKPSPIARRLPASVTDGASFDLIVRASALSAGSRVFAIAYLAVQDSVAGLSAIVIGEEAWRSTLSGQQLDLWVVEMDFGGLASTLWIDKATRALARQTIRLAPDVTIMWTRPSLVRVSRTE